MAENQDGAEKSEEATSKKRDDARKEGNVAKSIDLSSGVLLLAAVAAMYVYVPYMLDNFENLVEIIDQLGGIQVMLTEEEAEYYRENGMPDIVAGNVTLTGSQALAHARNRSLDNDFGRTERQRDVIYGIYTKVLEQRDPATVLSLVQFCMTQVKTNMSVTELYDMAMEVLSVDNLTPQQAAVPAEGTYEFGTYEDMSVLNIDLEANKQKIEELLY